MPSLTSALPRRRLKAIKLLPLLAAGAFATTQCTASEPLRPEKVVTSGATSPPSPPSRESSAKAHSAKPAKGMGGRQSRRTTALAFKGFPRAFTALQKIDGLGRHRGKTAYARVTRKDDLITVQLLEPFLKSPLAKAKIGKSGMAITWHIPKPKFIGKAKPKLLYLYQFYTGKQFKRLTDGRYQFAPNAKDPALRFSTGSFDGCVWPATIHVVDPSAGKKGRNNTKSKSKSKSAQPLAKLTTKQVNCS